MTAVSIPAELSSAVDSQGLAGGSAATDTASLLASLDADSSGTINSNELTNGAQALYDALRAQMTSPEGLASADSGKADDMSKIDSNQDGSVDASELDTYLSAQHAEAKANDPKLSAAGQSTDGDLMASIQALLSQYRTASTGFAADSAATLLSAVA